MAKANGWVLVLLLLRKGMIGDKKLRIAALNGGRRIRSLCAYNFAYKAFYYVL